MTTLELEPVDYYCQHCDSAMEYTSCIAECCAAYRCLGCGAGCDLWVMDNGVCAIGIRTMTYAQRLHRSEERRLARDFGRPIITVHLPDMDMS